MIKLQKELEIINFKLVLYYYVGNKNEDQEFNHFFEYQYILIIGQKSHLLSYYLKKSCFFFFFPSHQGIL